ncbi:MAG TPA: hypothetical protein VGF04_03285 [Solirubrobacterales bacterium]
MEHAMGRLLLVSACSTLLFSGPVDDADGKGKAACRAGTVPVRVGKKKTCRPLAKVFPKPKAVDLRLAYLRTVLRFDPAKVLRGKKRKRARTLQSGFGAAGRRAQRKLLKALPKALAFLDRKRGGAHASRIPAESALASGGCQAGYAGPIGHLGGASVGLLGDNGGYIEASAGGSFRVRITFASCGGVGNFRLPQCPAADGSVDGKGSGQFQATIEIWDGNRLVSRNSSVFADEAKVHGQVGADGKLKFVDVEHTQEIFIVASGGIVVRGGVTRKVRINMPGRYDPEQASVVYFGDKISSDSGADGFASTASHAITAYKNVEPHWSTFSPPFCAEPVFSPEKNTLKLRKGEEKQLSVYAKSLKDGGRATEARWTLLSPENADFSPKTTGDPAPNIAYKVTNAPKGGQVKVTVKFTSTAGVGEKTWTQPTEPGINHLSGSFIQREEEGGSIFEWAGKANFNRSTEAYMGGSDGQYEMAPGTFTVTASGSGFFFSPALSSCTQSGSGQFALSPPDSGFFVLPRLTEADPYLYVFTIQTSGAELTYPISITCPNPEDSTSTSWFANFTISPLDLQKSADGIDFSGSETVEEGELTITREWSFHGTE